MKAACWGTALGMIMLLTGCGEEEPPPAPVVRPVRSQVVSPTGSGTSQTLPGVARAGIESSLSFRVAGTVEEITVGVGDVVEKDQLLARISSTDYELRLQQAQASLAQAEAAARNAAASFDRVRGLYENNNASKADFDGARAASESARAQVQAAAKQVQLARQQLSYTRLVAPVAGSVASVDVDVNENVGGGTPVILLTAGDRLDVEIAVPEATIGRLQTGMPVEVTFDALGDAAALKGTVAEVGVTSSRTATTYPVKVTLDDSHPEVRAGMAADVRFTFAGAGEDAIRVPPVAVGEDREGRFVMVLEADADGMATAKRRSVEVGGLNEAGLEVTSGLEPGERIATAGVQLLEEGMRVRLMEPAAP